LVVAASVVLSAQLSPPASATAKIGEAALIIPLCPLSRSGPQTARTWSRSCCRYRF